MEWIAPKVAEKDDVVASRRDSQMVLAVWMRGDTTSKSARLGDFSSIFCSWKHLESTVIWKPLIDENKIVESFLQDFIYFVSSALFNIFVSTNNIFH